jgi:hypothetical protein
MAETHGSHTRIYAGGLDISGLFRDVEAGRTRELVDVTAFGDTADASIVSPIVAGDLTASGMLEVDLQTGARPIKDMLDAAGQSLTGETIIVSMLRDTTLGDPGFALIGSTTNNHVKSLLSDVVQTTFDAKANRSAWVKSLHPLAARTAAHTTTGLDNAALSSYGGVGVLAVTAISGSSPVLTFKIQHSSDSTNGVDGAWVDLATFDTVNAAAVTARYHDHQVVAGTVNRWLRITMAVTSGSLTSCTFTAQFGRYTTNK